MIEVFFPDLVADRVQNIDLDKLKHANIKGLILDIDNTLVPSHMKEADQNAVEWIERVKESGLKVCIVSNASKKRVIKFNEKLKLFAFHRAFKPGGKTFMKALRLMDIRPQEAAVVGDQIFTDVYGANKLHMYSVLVKPIHKSEFFFVRLKRFPEKFILARYIERINRGNA
jgi:HAD superfamily phosphatase (TIGR01668 family)